MNIVACYDVADLISVGENTEKIPDKILKNRIYYNLMLINI